MSSSLRALLDGQPLPPDEAHALWTRFSAYMDENQGDFAGFAAALGYVEAKVGMVDGQPTLQLSSQRGADARKGGTKPKRRNHPAPRGKESKAKKPKAKKPKAKKPKAKKAPPRKAGPQKPRRDRGVDIGDAKPKRPRRK